jgi:hypothetical protein
VQPVPATARPVHGIRLRLVFSVFMIRSRFVTPRLRICGPLFTQRTGEEIRKRAGASRRSLKPSQLFPKSQPGFSASTRPGGPLRSKPVQYLYDTVATIKKMSAPAKASPRGFSSSLDATMTTARNSTNDTKQQATSFRKDMTRRAWNMGVSRYFRSERGERIRKPKGRQVCRSRT